MTDLEREIYDLKELVKITDWDECSYYHRIQIIKHTMNITIKNLEREREER